MLRERNQTFKLMFIGLDLVLSGCAFVLATVLHFFVLSPEQRAFVMADTGGMFAPGLLVPEEHRFIVTYFYLGILIAVCQVATFIATDLYHPRRGLSTARETFAILRGVFLSLVVVLALLFFYRGTSFSRAVILYNAAFSVLLVSAGHYIFRMLMGRLRARGFNTRHVLILGTGPNAARLLTILKRHAIYGYRVLGLLGPASAALPELKDRVIGSLRDLKRVARELQPDLIVYAMPHKKATLQDVIEFCDKEGIDCRIVPDMVELLTARARLEDMDGMPLLTIRDIPLKNGYNRFVKRGFDLVMAGLFLILMSPVYFLIALLVKLDSRGPVLFAQDRVGLDRRTFRVYKFRTMVVQDKQSSDLTWGSAGDARVTRIGKYLRKYSLDELPQFLNVIKGDMSIVGPRPERPHFVKQFKSRYAHYMRRHSAKAGITGWAQIQGWRGDTSIEKRVEADIYYIENWSLWFDIMIALRTPRALLTKPGE